jgi:cell wall-associated NlpC family hydrolase
MQHVWPCDRLALLGMSFVLVACSSVSEHIGREGMPSGVRQPRVIGHTPGQREGARVPESERGRRAAMVALKYRGVPYQWGSAGPSGFDCSGLVRHVYAQVGVWLPHNAAQQFDYGTPVGRDELQPGDLVFFDRLRHIGIYLGEGRIIHARQTGKHVGVALLDDEWFRARWVGARRL